MAWDVVGLQMTLTDDRWKQSLLVNANSRAYHVTLDNKKLVYMVQFCATILQMSETRAWIAEYVLSMLI